MVKNRVCAPTRASIVGALFLFLTLAGAALGQTSGLPSPSIGDGSASARPNPTGQTVMQDGCAAIRTRIIGLAQGTSSR